MMTSQCGENISKVRFEQGMALIVVLWLLFILTIMTFGLSRLLQTEVQLTKHYQNQARAELLAESGIWRGVAMAHRKAAAALKGERIVLDGRVYPLKSEDGDLAVSIQSLHGLIDLNRAPEPLIKRLVRQNLADQQNVESIVDAIMDWRDVDSLVRLAGAETEQYQLAGLAYRPNNGDFVEVAELLRVYGVDEALYQQIRPALTVTSGEARIDISVAPKQVLQAIPGLTNQDVDRILQDRVNGNDIDLSLITAQARRHIGSADLNNSLRVSSLAQVGQTKVGIVAEVELRGESEQPVVILSWRYQIDDVLPTN